MRFVRSNANLEGTQYVTIIGIRPFNQFCKPLNGVTEMNGKKHEMAATYDNKELMGDTIKTIIRLADLFKQLIASTLLLTFAIVACLLFSSFTEDLLSLLRQGFVSNHGLLHAFGTLLILWTVTELIHAEIGVLKGHKFGVEVLVDVAMAAAVRKILLSDFQIDLSFYGAIGALVSLAGVRWLISVSERGAAKNKRKELSQINIDAHLDGTKEFFGE